MYKIGSKKKTKFLVQLYKKVDTVYQKDSVDHILVIAKNMENKNEISKTYKYSQLYKYYQAIPDYEDVEPDVDNLIKIISKYVMIGHFSKDDQLQIRLKKNQISRRDSTPIVQSTSMNIVKEEEKSSQNIKFESSSPEKKSDQMLTNSSITPYRSIKRLRKHQRQSSKTTKKLELSIGSIVRSSNDGGTFISRDLVKAKSKSDYLLYISIYYICRFSNCIQ